MKIMPRAKMSNKLFFPAASVKPFLQQFTQTEIVYLHAGAHKGVYLAVMTGSLYRRYSALKPIKYQTLSLQVSNLEQATAFLF